jgi:hypothetical protein
MTANAVAINASETTIDCRMPIVTFTREGAIGSLSRGDERPERDSSNWCWCRRKTCSWSQNGPQRKRFVLEKIELLVR